jgi:hypothetical protein
MLNKVVSGFPGIGKSWLSQNPNGRVIADSDSSNFSWSNQSEKIRNPEWPSNYIRHIIETREKADFVFVSTHKEVRDAIVEASIPFTLVYPGPGMKAEYIERYVSRGNTSGFVKLLEQNYQNWIAELAAQQGCRHLVLMSGQYLADVL